MTTRPYVLVSCATSIDGYLDDATDQRLLLSNDDDLDRVDEVRASCDAILVGATTVRRDDPRLLVRSARRRAQRLADGRPASPTRVTLTGCGDLDPSARFFTVGDTERIVYCSSSAAEKARDRLAGLATVVDAGEPVDPVRALDDLAARGVRRLMVEGGATVHAQFLTAGLVDELHLVVAPFFVGDGRAPRFAGEGRFPWHSGRRARLAEVRQIGDVVLLRYALSDRCPG
ncbi:RibD family protein [Micromonospora endolithica]|uniref:Deaminase n=1 Tax=Micromonospora endolithica TaxID=230091 RepID=A0A3A9ZHN2_9ACTN|nr:dihydrofolate reductase family protein [Micromonospora endolithica]RKN47858.1 deaminase [Micromonospora endolithica]TWJ21554.1 5-amino-6-(5-phosphoribosylamino)uracil reductase [Micromonospora endolithica]